MVPYGVKRSAAYRAAALYTNSLDWNFSKSWPKYSSSAISSPIISVNQESKVAARKAAERARRAQEVADAKWPSGSRQKLKNSNCSCRKRIRQSWSPDFSARKRVWFWIQRSHCAWSWRVAWWKMFANFEVALFSFKQDHWVPSGNSGIGWYRSHQIIKWLACND